jgi:hypothetical protein
MTDKDFWDWFQNKKSDIEKFIISDSDDYSIYDELTEKLSSYNELVIAELTKDTHDINVLILSCDGRIDGIPFVEKLYESAPIIENWRFQKFRMPGHVKELNYQGLQFKSNDIKIKYTPDEQYFNLELFIKGYNTNDDRYKGLAFLYLDHMVGEYNVMTKIGNIEFKKMNLFTSSNDKISLEELKTIIEKHN